jgi:DNA-binding MarR family transcriptional regulator
MATTRRSRGAQLDLEVLYRRPGFLLRRAHQISSALFMQETSALNVTTTQFGMLTILAAREPIDQIGIAKLLKLDRSTTGLVVRNLEERGLIERVTDPGDRRRRMLRSTAAGRQALTALKEPARTAHDRGLSVFTADEARTFVSLLSRFVDGHDGTDQ